MGSGATLRTATQHTLALKYPATTRTGDVPCLGTVQSRGAAGPCPRLWDSLVVLTQSRTVSLIPPPCLTRSSLSQWKECHLPNGW